MISEKAKAWIFVFIFLCIAIGAITGTINKVKSNNLEYQENFKRLNGCEECGDVLVKCNNGSYELVQNDNSSLKKICGKLFSMETNTYISKEISNMNISLYK